MDRDPVLVNVVHDQVEDADTNWCVHTTKTYDDGSVQQGCYVFPKDSMEWRAAEYGIDPSDLDTLLDIVIVEPYLLPEDWAGEIHLFDALTLAEAREAHIRRIARAKLRLRITTRSKAPDPEVRSFLANKLGVAEEKANELDFLRVQSDMDPTIIRVKSRISRDNVGRHQTSKVVAKRNKLSREDRIRNLEKEGRNGR